MIFELDPLITEEQPDEIEEQAETSEKLQKFMEYRDPSEDLKEVSLLKTIGVPPPAARNQNLALQAQKTDAGNNNQLVPENMINIDFAKDKVLSGI